MNRLCAPHTPFCCQDRNAEGETADQKALGALARAGDREEHDGRAMPVLECVGEAIERAEIVRHWLEDAARCHCPTLDDCPLFEDPVRLPERSSLVLR